MKLYNKTKYDSKWLKSLIYETAKHLRGYRKRCKYLNITFTNRKWGISGRAIVSGCWIQMKLPPEIKDIRELTYVIMHEMAHNLGEYHRDMYKKIYRNYNTFKINRELFAFADSYLPIKYGVMPLKQARNIREERYQKALKMLKYYTSREKRIKNLKKKWESKVKYYERG